MEKRSLMARPGGSSRHPISRGFEEPINCAVTKCPCNNGTSLCLSPTLAKIGSDGVCECYKKYIGATNLR